MPFLVRMILLVIVHDLDHGDPAGIVITLHHGNQGEPEGVAAPVIGFGDPVMGSTASDTVPLFSPFKTLFFQNAREGVGKLRAVFLFIHRPAHRRSPPIPPE